MTNFGGDVFVPPNSINFDTVFTKFNNIGDNWVVLTTVIGLIVAYYMGAMVCRKLDHMDLVKVGIQKQLFSSWVAYLAE